ncbi:serine hydrolase [Aureisphaera galaxeae]|uniref:serine hydrolase domain-containing protein n=1 Tax=Aureisphaera galaxeae TaxID=1538023 RepID=UPI002350D780|nr:serine hydrolase domain-containing protein [Aureisphaera galaxeae]MDC8004002.1 serine hydrolase [Aureisphaera galaxeae]
MRYKLMKIHLVVTLACILCFVSCKKKEVSANMLQTAHTLETTAYPIQDNYDAILKKMGLANRMEAYGVPGISMAIIKNGSLDWTMGYGKLQANSPNDVDVETLFSVGSISKVGTALMVLKLVKEGKLDLDTDVNIYLKSWKVETNRFTQEHPVTLRNILSHTAGFTVHGFADYMPEESLPTTRQILDGDYPAKNSRVYINLPVGSRYRYSGGGTTVVQQIIEEITGKSFHEAADDLLFSQLNMNRSSYENPLPETLGNIAKAHNRNGKPVALPRGYQAMPEAAASGLWTTPTDFSEVILMLLSMYHEEGAGYLTQVLVKDMMRPVRPSEYGLGPRIKVDGDNIYFEHGGANDSYRAKFIASLKNKSGIILFTNGTNGSNLIDEIIPEFDFILQ